MAYSSSFPLILFSVIILIACTDAPENSTSVTVVPQEATSAGGDSEPLDSEPLNEQQIDILNAIKIRSNEDGARYVFDDLNPVFEEANDRVKVAFEYINPNTAGGSPVVEYSLSQQRIISIAYTR